MKIYDYLWDNEGKHENEKRQFCEFKIEDLLYRESIAVNSEKTRNFYTGKSVLVTGGSIGSELCRQIAALEPKQLTIVDIYENNVYDVQQELIRKYGNKLKMRIYI